MNLPGPASPSAPAALRPPPLAPAPGRARPAARLRALDGLRILAALTVCLYHFAGKNGTVAESWHQSPGRLFPDLSDAAVYGCLGVQLFFVISGFVICMSSWGRTLGDFFRSRVARLYPAYWVAIVLVTAASFALPAVVHHVRSDAFLVNLTMLQQPMGVPRVLGVCWTLWVEVRFYALFALFVVWRGVTYRRVVLFCVLWTLAGAFARVADTPLTDELVMRDHAPFFIGGLALYLIHRFGSDLLLWSIVGVSFLLGQRYSVTALWHPGPQGDFHRNPYVIQLIVALSFLAVAAVALGWLRWANWRWLSTAGALTYPFYLIHEHLGWFAIRVLHRGLGLPPQATLVLSVGSLLGVAWLIHRFVERPYGPRLKRAMAVRAAR
ncbi:acyltransferase [Streptomyces sp. VRA16 Mangrove soil]|uniref:acyltransferase family protein n=1 Tax=Streptomyces sp. VRA16 Mangrove soil TaxID=2817434 RepID=UPI001A9D2306|nr:acyltransferase [Streptomyces sp. VRA16 Mangrove soil]MBO1334813.1 acyltransferase [Streptomyces sp. VRA16 Mangrove soil]